MNLFCNNRIFFNVTLKKKFTLKKKIVKSTGDFAIITEKLKIFCSKI